MTCWECYLPKCKMVFLFLLFIALLSYNSVKYAYSAQSDEQNKLMDTYFGDFSNATKIKSTGQVKLVVWKPHIQKLQNAGLTALITQTRNLTIDYDEIWEIKDDALNITRLYWKGGKVQAAVVLKEYISNPITNEKFPKPEYKITDLYSRNEILQELNN